VQEKQFPAVKKQNRGSKAASLILVAAVFTIVGILIATNLDLPSRTVAQLPVNITETGLYPVVRGNDGEMESPFVNVVDKVKNAVVNIFFP